MKYRACKRNSSTTTIKCHTRTWKSWWTIRKRFNYWRRV